MIYLSHHLDSKSNVSSQKLQKNDFDYCPIESHVSYHLNLICLEKNCDSNRIICVLCSYQFHKNHYIIPIKILSDRYQDFLNNETKSESLTQIPLEEATKLSTEINKKSKEFCESRLQIFSDFEINFSNFIETQVNSIKDSRSLDENITLIESEKALTAQMGRRLIHDLLSQVKEPSKLDQIEKIDFNHSIERDNIVKEIQNRSNLAILFKNLYESSIEKEIVENFNNFLKIKNVPNLLTKNDSYEEKLKFFDQINIENSENRYLFYPISYNFNENKYNFMVFDGIYLKFFNSSSNTFTIVSSNKSYYINDDIDILGFFFIPENINIIVQFNENNCLRFWKLITDNQILKLEFLNDLKVSVVSKKNITIFKKFILFGADHEILIKEINISNNHVSLQSFENCELEEKFDFFCKFPDEDTVCFVEKKNRMRLLNFDSTKNHFNYRNITKFEPLSKLLNFYYNESDDFLVNFILNKNNEKKIVVWQSNKKIREYFVEKNVNFFDQRGENEFVFGEAKKSYLLTDRKIYFLDLLK